MRVTPLLPILLVALAAACQGRPRGSSNLNHRAEAWTAPAPPADVSHGEAAVGTTAAPAPVDPRAPAPATDAWSGSASRREAHLAIAPGVVYEAWTFDGRVPGPAVRVTAGDTVDFTLVNRAMMPHSMDFHAAQIAPSRVYTNVMPGDSIHLPLGRRRCRALSSITAARRRWRCTSPTGCTAR